MLSFLSFAQSDPLCKDINSHNVQVVNTKQFIPDGKFYAFKLGPGEKMEIYKPFFAAKDYYFVVSCDDFLPGVKVTMLDMDKKVIYDTLSSKKEIEFNFKPEKNQNIIISLVVDNSKTITNSKGCVSMVVGYK